MSINDVTLNKNEITLYLILTCSLYEIIIGYVILYNSVII